MTEEDSIQLVLDRFDFQTVTDLMAARGWPGQDKGEGVPPDRLRDTAEDLLRKALDYEHDTVSWQSRGLMVVKMRDKLGLYFIPVDSTNEEYSE
jgi:hypothetical protein